MDYGYQYLENDAQRHWHIHRMYVERQRELFLCDAEHDIETLDSPQTFRTRHLPICFGNFRELIGRYADEKRAISRSLTSLYAAMHLARHDVLRDSLPRYVCERTPIMRRLIAPLSMMLGPRVAR